MDYVDRAHEEAARHIRETARVRRASLSPASMVGAAVKHTLETLLPYGRDYQFQGWGVGSTACVVTDNDGTAYRVTVERIS